MRCLAWGMLFSHTLTAVTNQQLTISVVMGQGTAQCYWLKRRNYMTSLLFSLYRKRVNNVSEIYSNLSESGFINDAFSFLTTFKPIEIQ